MEPCGWCTTWNLSLVPGWLWVTYGVAVLSFNWCKTCIRVAAFSGHVISNPFLKNPGLTVSLLSIMRPGSHNLKASNCRRVNKFFDNNVRPRWQPDTNIMKEDRLRRRALRRHRAQTQSPFLPQILGHPGNATPLPMY